MFAGIGLAALDRNSRAWSKAPPGYLTGEILAKAENIRQYRWDKNPPRWPSRKIQEISVRGSQAEYSRASFCNLCGK